ncbi:MAG: hypothetical protein IPN69_12010 [Acidobacteria bacterium]|nr:hypothetical protein [Acidobacteriota bacterium]
MAITKLANVPLIPQPTDGVCWYACARMLYRWSKATGRGVMTNPADDSGYHTRFQNNGDVAAFQNNHLGRALNMKLHSSLSLDYGSVLSFLQSHGPIWVGLKKNWGGHDHGHVVVICGVADTGVFIHDPEPMKQGSAIWLTWAQIKKAVDGMTDADPQFMTAA